MHLGGDSIRAIALKLRAEGVLPQRGTLWQPSSLQKILRNETYAGRSFYNRRKVLPDGKRAARPENEWIALQVPAIIDTSIFERAREQLLRNTSLKSGRNDKRFYVLRGLLRCGLCGQRIGGCASHGKPYYRCCGRDSLRALDSRCRSPWLLASRIESTVIDAVRAILKGGLLQEKTAKHAWPKKADPRCSEEDGDG